MDLHSAADTNASVVKGIGFLRWLRPRLLTDLVSIILDLSDPITGVSLGFRDALLWIADFGLCGVGFLLTPLNSHSQLQH